MAGGFYLPESSSPYPCYRVVNRRFITCDIFAHIYWARVNGLLLHIGINNVHVIDVTPMRYRIGKRSRNFALSAAKNWTLTR